MSITLSDHQLDKVDDAVEWFSDASKYQGAFESDYGGERFSLAGRSRNVISSGQAFVFTGHAGSGKSTCTGPMVERFGVDPSSVMFMAPTGKAALVLTEKLREDGWGSRATTIHKAIYTPKSVHADRIKTELDNVWTAIAMEASGDGHNIAGYLAGKSEHELRVLAEQLQLELAHAMDKDSPAFALKDPHFVLNRHEECAPDIKLMVVDEASMVGTVLANDLASYGIPILAIGDPGQLPPVEDTWGFDMQNPDAMLTEVHRQAKDSPIIELATKARRGEEIKIGDYGDDVTVVDRRNDNATYDMDRDAMILVGTHKKRWMVTKKIRAALGFTETGPMAGEPLIICKNSTKHPGLVNGTIVTNKTDHGNLQNGNAKFDLTVGEEGGAGEETITVTQSLYEEHYFKQRNSYSAEARMAFASKRNQHHTDWAHAITVHKAQGSEWDDVVVHDESGVFRQDAGRWLYTALTRAKRKLTIIV